MIVELGHFSLILAFFVALVQATVPMIGAARGDTAWMAVARPAAVAQFPTGRPVVFLPDLRLRGFRLLGPQRGQQFAFGQADALQDLRRLGEPRGLDGPVGTDPRGLRFGGGAVRAQPAGRPAGADAVDPGADLDRLPAVHPGHLEPVHPAGPGAGRRPWPQSAAAGPRPRLPSTVPLSRLCRLLDRLFLCHRGADRGPRRRPPGRVGCGRGRWPPGSS